MKITDDMVRAAAEAMRKLSGIDEGVYAKLYGDLASKSREAEFVATARAALEAAFGKMWRKDFENAPSPCLGECIFPAGREVRMVWRNEWRGKTSWEAHGCEQTVARWCLLPSPPVGTEG